MDAVAGSVAVTLQNAVQTEEDLIWPPGVLNRFGEL
jgi:hypothetical protein